MPNFLDQQISTFRRQICDMQSTIEAMKDGRHNLFEQLSDGEKISLNEESIAHFEQAIEATKGAIDILERAARAS